MGLRIWLNQFLLYSGLLFLVATCVDAQAPVIHATNPQSPIFDNQLDACPNGPGKCLVLTGDNFSPGMKLKAEILNDSGTQVRRVLWLNNKLLNSSSVRVTLATFAAVKVRFTLLSGPTFQISSNPLTVEFRDNAFDAQFNVDKTSGVAPLSVFVDGMTTTGLVDNDFVNSNYKFNFDVKTLDPYLNEPEKTGFIAGNTYLKAGTYDVQADIIDKVGKRAISTRTQVVVQDPEFIFSPAGGGQTYCVTTPTAPNFTGCPTTNSSNHIVTSNLQQVLNLLGPKVRVLLNRNAVWTTAVQLNISNKTGPWTVSAYPDPFVQTLQKPKIISTNTQPWASMVSIYNSHDGRFGDIHLEGNSTGAWIAGGSNITGINISHSSHLTFLNFLITKTDLHGVYFGNGLSPGTPSYLTFANFTIRDFVSYGFYGVTDHARFDNFSITDSKDPTHPQHGLRIQGGQYNILEHGVFERLLPSMTSLTVRGNNNFTVIRNNRFQECVAIRPQYDGVAEFLNNVLYESNYHEPDPSQNIRLTALELVAKDVALRNNVFRNINGAFSLSTLQIVGGAERVTISNNTYINTYNNPSNLNDGEHTFLHIGANNFTGPSLTKSISIFNNLYYSLSITSYSNAIRSYAPINEISANNNGYYVPNLGSSFKLIDFRITNQVYTFANWQTTGNDVTSFMANPNFVSVDPSNPLYLTLSSNSPAIDKGRSTGVSEDFIGNTRAVDGDGDGTVRVDIGALERQ